MPELPEVETIKLGLQDKIVGKTIDEVVVLRDKSWQGDKTKVVGQKIDRVERQAKVIIIKLENNYNLIVHLKMTGQLVFRNYTSNINKPVTANNINKKPEGNRYDVDELPNKYTRVIIKFKDNSALFFNDLRVFGWVKAVEDEDLNKELKNFSGVEPLSDGFTTDYLKKFLSSTSRAIKIALMDQKKIAGVGNIYANEALFCARIDPRREAKKVADRDPDKIAKLKDCIINVLKKGLKYKGTTDNDEAFRDVEGKKGQMQNHLKIYGQAGESCPNCSGKIKRVKLGGRSSFFCPQCQD